MGILQSCQTINDPLMQMDLDTRLLRTRAHYSTDHYYYKSSKMPIFTNLFHKKLTTSTQFVLQTAFSLRNAQVVNCNLKVFEDSNTFIKERGMHIKVLGTIEDPNRVGHKLYIVKDRNKDALLKIIPFNRYEEDRFKEGVYEVAMGKRNNAVEGMVVESGIDKDSNDKCLIIMQEGCNATLHEMITYRKLTNSPWSESQFSALCYQLISGVVQMHEEGFAHRDIRPHNVYYCPLKKVYVFGGNGASVGVNNKSSFNLSGVPYYIPKSLYQIAEREEYSEYYNYSPISTDMYALGITIVNALFLDNFTAPNILCQSLAKYQAKWPFLSVIRTLTTNSADLPQIMHCLSEKELREQNIVQRLRLCSRPQDEQFVGKKRSISQAYYSMFMYDEWVEQINEVVNYYELNHNTLQLSALYEQIGDIYCQHKQTEIMGEYYGKAAGARLMLSTACLSQQRVDEAIDHLEKGIRANRKGNKNASNAHLAALLNQLAMAHHAKSQYEMARAFQEEALDIIAQVHGTASAEYAGCLLDSAYIESEFQEFQQAENMLKTALKVVEKKEEQKEYSKLKPKILQSLGNNYRMKAMEKRDKSDNYRKRAEEYLLDALELAERAEGSIDVRVGSVLQNLGNVYFDKREFEKAKKSYEKALVVKQHTLQGRDNVQVGLCLTYLANSEKLLKEYDKAIRHYDEAIQVFRKAYGNDHNEHTAVAIGNLGLVYKEIGKTNQQKQYLLLAKSILKELFGDQCPDYQYFDRQMTK